MPASLMALNNIKVRKQDQSDISDASAFIRQKIWEPTETEAWWLVAPIAGTQQLSVVFQPV
jgi:hypothetical protein